MLTVFARLPSLHFIHSHHSPDYPLCPAIQKYNKFYTLRRTIGDTGIAIQSFSHDASKVSRAVPGFCTAAEEGGADGTRLQHDMTLSAPGEGYGLDCMPNPESSSSALILDQACIDQWFSPSAGLGHSLSACVPRRPHCCIHHAAFQLMQRPLPISVGPFRNRARMR